MFARWWSSPSSPFVQVTALFEKISLFLSLSVRCFYDLFRFHYNRGSIFFLSPDSSIISRLSMRFSADERSNFRIVSNCHYLVSSFLFSPPLPSSGEYRRIGRSKIVGRKNGNKKIMETEFRRFTHGAIMNNAPRRGKKKLPKLSRAIHGGFPATVDIFIGV